VGFYVSSPKQEKPQIKPNKEFLFKHSKIYYKIKVIENTGKKVGVLLSFSIIGRLFTSIYYCYYNDTFSTLINKEVNMIRKLFEEYNTRPWQVL
jgi:hypothetical protein